MSQMTRFAFTGGALLALCAAFSGCSSRTNVSATGSTPSQFTHVYITTQEVWFNTKQDASPDDSGWAKFPLKTPVTIDLVTESNGTLGEIANDLRIAPGTYNSVLLMPVPIDWTNPTAAVASAIAVGATYNEEADYTDTAGTTHQVPLVLPNPEKGVVIPGSLKVPVGKVGAGGIGTASTSSTAGTTNTTTNLFGTTTTTPTTTTPTTSTSSTTTTVSFATSFDANRDLHLFCYVIASTGSCAQSATGTTTGTATGAILSANPTATDLSTTGGITGTLTLTSLTNINSVSDRVAIQASAESLSADGTHHVIVASAPVQTDGTFTIYPLQSNSSTPTVYDVVIHGPNIFTIIIKNVSVTTTTPSLTGAASTTGSVATTTATGAVSIGTFIPTAAPAFVANITPTATASLPPGAAVTFYQTLPASSEVPYAIDEVGIDPLNLNLQTAEQLSTGNIQSGTYSSSGSTITVTSSTPTETTNAKGLASYRVGATAPLYADGALSFSTMVVSNTASLVPAPSTTTTTTAPTPVAVTVPSLTPANSSAAGSIAAAITVPAGSYTGGELIVSHNGAMIGAAPIASSTLLNGTGSATVNGLPSGDAGNYYLSVILWTSSSFKAESITSPVTVTGGSATDVAVAVN
ncbi:MAG TPA: DUF4382 domain-containing protein [Steroidobacteraceae bacterium]|nr:DUF4382 domain-containing protein [Steroidobacteraceae bacterium]